MEIRPIRNHEDYQAALAAVAPFFEREPEVGSVEGDTFEVLLTLIDAYESKLYPITTPDPIEAIKFRMEQSGLTVHDLVPMIGAKNRVYEVLAGTRPLTLAMIRALHSGLGLAADVLIQPRTIRRSPSGEAR
ncbi:helix-turn-helix domain-containing protein [Roseateles amylovorans]|uniref:Transcriptional regulator n=1 Tax=Roseateles amylovorans TaxID=2978473 RepID=A0ABY6AWG3_9BURK|nr:transcriptional regulator [Roseateles amylovorans]UXH77516.1 transcriptional regulator [Roseateles amylovorans]